MRHTFIHTYKIYIYIICLCKWDICARADTYRARRKPFNLAADSREIIGSERYISVISSAPTPPGRPIKRASGITAKRLMFLPYFLFLRDVEEGRDSGRGDRRSDTILSSDRNIHTCTTRERARAHARTHHPHTHTHTYVLNALSEHICGHSAHTWPRLHTRSLVKENRNVPLNRLRAESEMRDGKEREAVALKLSDYRGQ